MRNKAKKKEKTKWGGGREGLAEEAEQPPGETQTEARRHTHAHKKTGKHTQLSLQAACARSAWSALARQFGPRLPLRTCAFFRCPIQPGFEFCLGHSVDQDLGLIPSQVLSFQHLSQGNPQLLLAKPAGGGDQRVLEVSTLSSHLLTQCPQGLAWPGSHL